MIEEYRPLPFEPKANGNPFFQLMVNDLDYFVLMVSIHFPFSHPQVLDYWDILEKGSAHYTVYLSDIETTFKPQLGLCFNSNIQWTDLLKKNWQVGFEDPYSGYITGVGSKPVEYDSQEELMLRVVPLDLKKEDHEQLMANINGLSQDQFIGLIESEQFDLQSTVRLSNYNRLSFELFFELYSKAKNDLLYNSTIWSETLAYEFTEAQVLRLLRLARYKRVVEALIFDFIKY